MPSLAHSCRIAIQALRGQHGPGPQLLLKQTRRLVVGVLLPEGRLQFGDISNDFGIQLVKLVAGGRKQQKPKAIGDLGRACGPFT